MRWRVFSRHDADHGILVQVGEVRKARDAVAVAVARSLAMPLVVALPVLGVLVWIAVTFGLAPLGAIGRAVSPREPADVKPLAIASPPREVEPLISGLNALFARIRAALAHGRRFTADAAHELRTPIAALRAQAEVALGTGDSAERRRPRAANIPP